jgi:hypothetical protein
MIPTRALSLAAAVGAATPTMGQFSVTFVLSGRTTGTTGGGGTIVGGGTLSLVNVHNLSDAFLFNGTSGGGSTSGGLANASAVVIATSDLTVTNSITTIASGRALMQISLSAVADWSNPNLYLGSIGASVVMGSPAIVRIADTVPVYYTMSGSGLFAPVTGLKSTPGGVTFPSGSLLTSGDYQILMNNQLNNHAGTTAGNMLHSDRPGAVTGTFVRMPCYANCDASTTNPRLNTADFTCFLQRYANGEPYANCDNSTATPSLTTADFTCYLQKYAAGCSGL